MGLKKTKQVILIKWNVYKEKHDYVIYVRNKRIFIETRSTIQSVGTLSSKLPVESQIFNIWSEIKKKKKINKSYNEF